MEKEVAQITQPQEKGFFERTKDTMRQHGRKVLAVTATAGVLLTGAVAANHAPHTPSVAEATVDDDGCKDTIPPAPSTTNPIDGPSSTVTSPPVTEVCTPSSTTTEAEETTSSSSTSSSTSSTSSSSTSSSTSSTSTSSTSVPGASSTSTSSTSVPGTIAPPAFQPPAEGTVVPQGGSPSYNG